MLKTGEWMSIAVLGLIILFIFTLISFFLFLIGPKSTGPTTTVEPSSALIQIISISIGPAIALSLFSNKLSEGSKLSYSLILISGILLIVGMMYANTLVPKIISISLPEWISLVPWIFSGFGLLLILIGVLSYKSVKLKIQRNSGFE